MEALVKLMNDRRDQLKTRLRHFRLKNESEQVMSCIQRMHEIDMLLESIGANSKNVLRKLMENQANVIKQE